MQELVIATAAATPFAGTVEHLAKAFTSGIGVWYEPHRLKRRSKAERESALEQAKNQVLIDLTKARGEGAVAELRAQAAARQEMLRIEHELNFQQVLAIADENIKAGDPVHKLEDAWANAFQDACETASEEEMQELWGRVLSGEIKAPGSFSLRAIEFLRTLSKRDADSFTNFLSVAFLAQEHSIVLGSKNGMGKFLSFEQLMHLISIGLVESESGMWPESDDIALSFGDRHLIFQGLRKHQDKPFLNVHALTSLGKELVKLVNSQSNYSYLDELLADPPPDAKKFRVALKDSDLKVADDV